MERIKIKAQKVKEEYELAYVMSKETLNERIRQLQEQIEGHEKAISMHTYRLEMAQDELEKLNSLLPNNIK